MDGFNQSSQQVVWSRLENALFEEVDVQDLRKSFFGGPVFHADDRMYRDRPAAEYWKVVVFPEKGVLNSRAFILTQKLEQLRAILILDEFRVYQITLAELEERTNLKFPDTLHTADTPVATTRQAPGDRKPLDRIADIHW